MSTLDIISKVCEITVEEASYKQKVVEKIDLRFMKLIDKGSYSCGAYLLQRKGKPFVVKSMGPLDYFDADKGSCKPNSIRYIASMTKLFTAVAIMQLIENGEIYLHQKVSEWLDELKNPMHETVTIFHLLTHTSGLAPDPGSYFEPYMKKWDKEASWFDNVLAGYPVAKPGERWSYSTAGFCILGRVLEVVTGVDYDRYVMDHIIKPLGLKRTFFHLPDAFKDEIIVAREWDRERMERPREERDGQYYLAGGSLLSCLEDMAVFGQMLMNYGTYEGVEILSRKSVEAMTSNQLNKSILSYCWDKGGLEKPYGLGVDKETQNCLFIEGFLHEGAGRSGIYMDRKEDFLVVYFQPLLNDDWDWPGSLGLRNIIWSGLK